MSRRRAEPVIADFPIHVEMIAQKMAEGQAFEGKHAAGIEQTVQAGGQQHVEIEVEPAIAVNRQVAKEIVPLNAKTERVHDRPILREFFGDESLHRRIVEKQIFIVRMQQPQIRHHGPGPQRLRNGFAGLDDALGNRGLHQMLTSLSFRLAVAACTAAKISRWDFSPAAMTSRSTSDPEGEPEVFPRALISRSSPVT